MLKAELRKKYLQKRKALSNDEAFLLSEKIFKNFINYFEPKEGDKIHIFIAIEKFKEINTHYFISYFLSQEIRVFVPKIMGNDIISVEIFEDSEYETNEWGISEPVSNIDSKVLDFDYVLTPLLYCDSKGNRVGYGKGFYDAFFESLTQNVKKIGVNYFNPDENIDDVWGNDIPLNYLVLPTTVVSFTGFV